MPSLLIQAGSQPQKQPRYAPLFIDRQFTGLWKQRSPLHDPSDVVTSKFYGGRPDALWDGLNVELTNKLTLQRRPGLVQFSPATYPTPPIHTFPLELVDGTIRVIVDTGYSPSYQMASVIEVSGVAFYEFFAPQACAANNAYRGLNFTVVGFDNATNNGTYLCTGSTSTYLILANTSAATDIANTSNATAQTPGGVYYDPQAAVGGIHNNYLLFAKSAGAGETGFISVEGILYAGDGVDTWKYTPLNNNGKIADLDTPTGIGSVWNYAIAAPTVQPVVNIVESGAAAVQWQASTFYSTMGLLVAGPGMVKNIYVLTSININGTNNNSNYATTGNGQPQWSNIVGSPPASGVDGTCNWINAGPLKLWTASTKFKNGDIVYVPGVGGLPLPNFSETQGDNTGKGVQCNGTQGGGLFQALINRDFSFAPNESATSGTATPAWIPNGGARTPDGVNPGIAWQYIGPADSWKPLHIYNSWWEHLQMAVVEPTVPANAAAIASGTQTFYVQRNNSQGPGTGATNVQGTSGTGYTPPWLPDACSNPNSIGQSVADGLTGEMNWLCLGCAAWKPTTQYTAWQQGQPLFSVVVDSNNNFQVCVQSGLSKSGTPPTWEVNYGEKTPDGSNGLVWVNVGSAADSTWVANTQWYFPAAGFTPPTAAQSYGGAEVIANGDVQAVVNSGLSGSSQPGWGPIGSHTQDFFATWFTVNAQTTFSLAWTKGYSYAYSYKSRATDDFYSVPSDVYTGPGQVTFTIPIPPGLNTQLTNGPLPPPTGAEVNGISEASPVFNIVGPNVGAVNFIKVTGSADPQVDTIIIWRSADGGGSANMFELTEIPNPTPINGQPQTVIFADYLPDTPTLSPDGQILWPGLNEEIQAPINGQNDPPPSNFIPMAYNFQRIWGSQGQSVGWSGGPDIITGNANECYLEADNFGYLANVVRIVKNSQGLLIGLTDSLEFIGGGPLTASFFSFTLAPGIGMGGFNSSDIYAGEIFFVSADSQFKSINPSLQLANLGFAIGEQIQAMTASQVYVTINQVGVDNALYIADGSTGWYRVNPHQVPQNEPIWSPFAAITNGCQMVQSTEISPGQKRLLVGGTGCNQHILERNLNVFTDNGAQYDAFFVMGSIMLAHPGQLALLKFIEADFSGVSYQPQVSYLLNEINDPAGTGVFVPMPKNPVFDPPTLYGTTIVPVSYSPNRYYFAATGSLARARHLQIKVDFGTTPNPDAIYNLTIFGRIVVEG